MVHHAAVALGELGPPMQGLEVAEAAAAPHGGPNDSPVPQLLQAAILFEQLGPLWTGPDVFQERPPLLRLLQRLADVCALEGGVFRPLAPHRQAQPPTTLQRDLQGIGLV